MGPHSFIHGLHVILAGAEDTAIPPDEPSGWLFASDYHETEALKTDWPERLGETQDLRDSLIADACELAGAARAFLDIAEPETDPPTGPVGVPLTDAFLSLVPEGTDQ